MKTITLYGEGSPEVYLWVRPQFEATAQTVAMFLGGTTVLPVDDPEDAQSFAEGCLYHCGALPWCV